MPKIKIHQEKTLGGGGGGGGGGATLGGTYMSLQQQTNFQTAKKENCIEPGWFHHLLLYFPCGMIE